MRGWEREERSEGRIVKEGREDWEKRNRLGGLGLNGR
jgi:hypothetical protein